MPGFGGTLDSTQLAQVVTYTRVTFGGADPAETVADCAG
jgi:mono/diheme cytochrome c family protein